MTAELLVAEGVAWDAVNERWERTVQPYLQRQ